MSYKFTTIPKKTLYQSILSTSTTFKMSDIAGFDGNDLTSADFGTVAYGVLLNSDKTVMELFSFDPSTIADTSISFVYRGLQFDGDLTTEVAANKLDWTSGSTILIGTDTPQVLQWLKEYIDGIAVAGSPDMDTTTKGIAQEATQAQVDAGTDDGSVGRLAVNPSTIRAKKYHDYIADAVGTDSYAITVVPAITAYAEGQRFIFKAGAANTGAATLNVCGLGAKDIKKDVSTALVTGDILLNQVVEVVYDGTNMQMVSSRIPLVPVIRTYNANTTLYGSTSTRFNITNTTGTTWRYTWNGVGTNPNINTTNFPTGYTVMIKGRLVNVNNSGVFTITSSGANYFEVTNASGIAQSDISLDAGFLYVSKGIQVWNKPTGLKYIEVETQAGGGGGSRSNSDDASYSGSGGGYSKKLIDASLLGTTENIFVGYLGIAGKYDSSSAIDGINAGNSYFGSHLVANGGITATFNGGFVSGGTATGGDINIPGGYPSLIDTDNKGGDSFLGFGGVNRTAPVGYGSGGSGVLGGGSANNGVNGADGIVIIKEFY